MNSVTVIEEARWSDNEQIVRLVNQAYRPPHDSEQGWTHEGALVAGKRINIDQAHMLFSAASTVLVMRRDQAVVACVHIQQHGNDCHIGMLATLPSMQHQGIGKQMLEVAETMAVQRYHAHYFKMIVLSSRPELLAYYLRRGYQPTGNEFPYPITAQVGVPMLNGLYLLELCKIAHDDGILQRL